MSPKPPRRSGQEPSAVLTKEAHERLLAELEDLRTRGRDDMAERLERAREHGDIRENAEYDAAKDAQGLMEARIRDIEKMLRDPDIVEGAQAAEEASAGILISVRPLEEDAEDEERFLLAASKEERHEGARTVSLSSPLGQALLGKRIGETVTYEAPGGTFTYEVTGLEVP